jgi:hypothetical protein
MAIDWGKVGAQAGTGAAVGSAAGPWGTAGGAIIGGGEAIIEGLLGDDDEGAPQAPPALYGSGQGSDLTNHLAALDYAEGLSQQQSQNAREAGFYGQAQGNYDIGNAAQLREAPQVAANYADQQRQTEALLRTNQGIGQLQSTGDYLSALGKRPMGDSYAEAQMRQGQNAAMAQQLAMARSGRSLGSGQAALTNAAFNNAGLNQQTNQAAAAARIQEQNAYNQFQANALGQAGQQYGAAGNLAGQAGNQATTIRAGNEGLQQTNAALQQAQQGVNNQTTGLYNTLGVQQQGLGMDANRLGTNAYQFGATQGSNKQQAQLNANVGQTSSTTATNLANAEADRAREAGYMNAISTGAGVAAENIGNAYKDDNATGAPKNPNDAYKNITVASNSQSPPNPGSDEKNKTGVQSLETPTYGSPEFETWAKAQEASWKKAHPGASAREVQGYHNTLYAPPESASVVDPNDPNHVTYTKADGTTEELNFTHGINNAMDDQDLGKIGVTGEGGNNPHVASYLETINALNNAYRPSQFAPADILNNVPGAGAGHSASQNAVIDRMMGRRAPEGIEPAPAAKGPFRSLGIASAPKATPAPAAPKSNWSDVFKAPALGERVSNYLAGQDQYTAPSGQMHYEGAPHVAPAPTVEKTDQYRGGPGERGPAPSVSPGGTQYRGSEHIPSNDREMGRPSDVTGKKKITLIGSDNHSKARIRELESQLDALNAEPPARTGETTQLPKGRERDFAQWLARNRVNDLDNPDSHYDYRGAYLAGEGRGAGSGHFTDRFKQHGHPSFSIESQYSRGANDGGTWEGEKFSPAVQPKSPDLEALDAAYARSQRPEGVDFRNARGYSYEYKNPSAPGATPGRQVGTMAQELERTDGAPYVHDTPTGKVVDTSRLPLALAPAIGHTQRRVDDLEQQLNALQGAGFGRYRPELYPQVGGPR